MRITVLLDYPDDANPQFTGGMTFNGGNVECVEFDDLFAKIDAIESILIRGVIPDEIEGN